MLIECEEVAIEVEGRRVTDLVEKPDDPPSRLATTGCYVLPEAVFAAARLLMPSDRGEYELADAIGVLVRAGATVEAVCHEGQRCNVNEPEDVGRAAELVDGS